MRKRRGQAEIIGAVFFVLIAFIALFSIYEVETGFVSTMNTENELLQQQQLSLSEKLVQLQSIRAQYAQSNVSSLSALPYTPSSPPFIYLLDGAGLVPGKTQNLYLNLSIPLSFTQSNIELNGISNDPNQIYLYVYALSNLGIYNLVESYAVPPLSSFDLSIPITSNYIINHEVRLLINSNYPAIVTTSPKSNIYYANVIISNGQSLSTPAPFQQNITITSSNPIWQYINTSNIYFGQNVDFMLNGQVLPSWLESYSSSSATWWISLPNGIAAQSSITVTMDLYPKNTNLFSQYTGKVGEAPQLSSSYGKYDDGANVFNFYDNFAGTNLNPKWTVFDNNNGVGSVSVNNGLTIKPTTTNGYYIGVYSSIKSITSTGMILETLVKPNGKPSNGYNDYSTFLGYGTTTNSIAPAYGYSGNFWGARNTYSFIALWQGNYYGLYYLTYTPDSATQGTIYQTSFSWFSNGNLYASDTSGASMSAIDTTYGISSATQIVISANGATNGKTQYIVYWVRIRAAPPNDIMPTVTFGTPAKSGVTNQVQYLPVQLSNYTFYKISNLGSLSLLNTNITTYYPNGTSYYLFSTPFNNKNSYLFTFNNVLPSSTNLSLTIDLYNSQTTADNVLISGFGGTYTALIAKNNDTRYTIPITTRAVSGGSLNIRVSGNQTTGVKEVIVQAITPNVIVENVGPYPVQIIRIWSFSNPPIYQNVNIIVQPGQEVNLSKYFTKGSTQIEVVTSTGNMFTFYD
ncbi:MAG: hypothetical protein ACP5NC_01275 [Nitrososphaeria archaeon]